MTSMTVYANRTNPPQTSLLHCPIMVKKMNVLEPEDAMAEWLENSTTVQAAHFRPTKKTSDWKTLSVYPEVKGYLIHFGEG